ncbi:MAG TPA: NAD-dependent epimerase/dehydratase family protein [Pseudomonadales bacterium]
MSKQANIIIAGCGYIGKLLAAELLDLQHQVIGLVSSAASMQHCEARGIDCRQLDFDDLSSLQQALPDCQARRIIYLAPPPGAGQVDSRLQNFLTALGDSLPEKFVLISTTGVYGDCGGRWVDEQTPINPRVDRARRRADAERQAQALCQARNIPLVILRVPGIYGAGKLPLARIESGAPIVNQQDSPYTNRIHAYDLVSICRIALLDERITGIYNCSDGQPGTMYEYFIKVADAAGLPRPPAITLQQAQQQLSAGMLSYMAESRRIGNARLLRDFGIKLQYPDLDAGLQAKPRG